MNGAMCGYVLGLLAERLRLQLRGARMEGAEVLLRLTEREAEELFTSAQAAIPLLQAGSESMLHIPAGDEAPRYDAVLAVVGEEARELAEVASLVQPLRHRQREGEALIDVLGRLVASSEEAAAALAVLRALREEGETLVDALDRLREAREESPLRLCGPR